MQVNQKVTGRSMSMAGGVITGVLSGLLLTIIGAAITATIVHRNLAPELALGYGSMITLLMSACLGAIISWKCVRRRKLLLCGLTGGGYYAGLLAITALFFGGQYRGMGVTALLVLAGAGCPAIMSGRKRGGKMRKRLTFR